MKIREAKSNVETKIAELLNLEGNFNLGELRNSEYYNDVMRHKIGMDSSETAAKSIIEKFTKSTTAAFEKYQ